MELANIANFEAQNRGNSAIGDTSPAHNFHRQREAQNRGFGEKSPEMATLDKSKQNDDWAAAPLTLLDSANLFGLSHGYIHGEREI